MKKILKVFLTFLCIATVALYFTACSNDDNPTGSQEYKGVPLVIVDTDDATLICSKDSTNDIKKVIENLKVWNRDEYL